MRSFRIFSSKSQSFPCRALNGGRAPDKGQAFNSARFFGLSLVLALAMFFAFTPAKAQEKLPLSEDFNSYEAQNPPTNLPENWFFYDSNGTKKILNDFKGKLLVVNFWATWCPPCVHEMPSLNRLQASMGQKGLQVITVSVDREGAKKVLPFMQSKQLSALTPYFDEMSTSLGRFRLKGLPTTLIISPSGKELGRLAGPAAWDGDAALALLNYYLQQQPSKTPPALPEVTPINFVQ
ncbi:MAG: TlpA disulfide reductase family protein [Alphaproteobacteria bacterium]